MDNDFDRWNKRKKKIEQLSGSPSMFIKEGEVWMTTLGKNVGHEQNGENSGFTRPVLIIKKFNRHMFWAIPLSTKQKSFDFYFNFQFNGQPASAILAQLKLLSVKRLRRKMYVMPPDILVHIRVVLRSLV